MKTITESQNTIQRSKDYGKFWPNRYNDNTIHVPKAQEITQKGQEESIRQRIRQSCEMASPRNSCLNWTQVVTISIGMLTQTWGNLMGSTPRLRTIGS